MKKCLLNALLKVSLFYFILIIIYFLILILIYINCYARQILSLQNDFLLQKSTIEEVIIGIKGAYTKH